LVEEEPSGWVGEITFAPYMFGPWDPSADIVVGKAEALLNSKYGLSAKLTNVYVEYSDYETIMNTRIAGGTAPDVWLGLNESGIRNYYRQGVIASWDRPFFEEHAPNLTAYINTGGSRGKLNVDRGWRGSMIATGDDGKMCTLPQAPVGEPYGQKGVVYRGDWLTKLGVTEPPYELDEWIELMYRFVEEDPDGNGQKDTYAFSATMIKSLFAAYGMYTGFIGGSSQYYYRDGRVQCADTLPENKEVLELCARLYRDGLIDPTFVATESNPDGYWAISPAFINGQIGVSAHASFDHFRRKEVNNDDGGAVAVEYWAVNGPDSDFVYGPWIKGPYGHGYYLDNDYGLGESYVYNIDLEKDPDKLGVIFQLLDIFAIDDELMMLACYGVEGETYDYNDEGTPRMLNSDNAANNAMGVWALRSLYGCNNSYNPIQNEFWYKAPAIQRILELQSQPYYDTYLTSDITGFPASRSTYSADLYAYRDETWINIITGELPVDYYDTYVQEYLARGGQVIEDECNAMYAEQN
jgi:putative aldouronate transport system substrate-binding protein